MMDADVDAAADAGPAGVAADGMAGDVGFDDVFDEPQDGQQQQQEQGQGQQQQQRQRRSTNASNVSAAAAAGGAGAGRGRGRRRSSVGGLSAFEQARLQGTQLRQTGTQGRGVGGGGGGGSPDGGGGGGGDGGDDDMDMDMGDENDPNVYNKGGPMRVHVVRRFEDFWNTYGEGNADDDVQMVDGAEGDVEVSYYERKLREHLITTPGKSGFGVDLSHIEGTDMTLYKWFEHFPRAVIPEIDAKVRAACDDLAMEEEPAPRILHPFNLSVKSHIRSLDPSHIDSLVALKGIVIRTSELIPEMTCAVFRCQAKVGTGPLNSQRVCMYKENVPVEEGGKVVEPESCPACKKTKSMTLSHGECIFSDKQLIKLQESPEDMPAGETPQTIQVFAYSDLVDFALPGDRVEVTGVYRCKPLRVTRRVRTLKSVFKTFVDAYNIQKTASERMRIAENDDQAQPGGDEVDLGFTQQEIDKFKEIADMGEGVYKVLVKSFAPSIWENDDVKKGLLCQLFGGNACYKTRNKDGKVTWRVRGEMNILLCGDPSTAKSQLLGYSHKIAHRATQATGRGTSATGLTAYILKDPETKEVILESGALVLGDRGLCCIDEFDKMDDSARAILHEAMEQQTVSIAKAGMVCSLNARTAVLACANPVLSRYDPTKSIVANINLPPTLMSRFDLIYLMLDKSNATTDEKLARHIALLYCGDAAYNMGDGEGGEGEGEGEVELLDRKLLANYISYARTHVKPRLTNDAAEALQDEGGSSRRNITATPRQLESLIRISEALARMQLKEMVEPAHVREAVRLMRAATFKAAVDPHTGRIDMDALFTGTSNLARERTNKIEEATVEALRNAPNGMKAEDLLREVNQTLTAEELETLDQIEFDSHLAGLVRNSVIRETAHKVYLLVVTE
ncbi:unnamed protein product [Vitrella brassicaformis CCMP3155]|uniref:DNA replication licensing factor MCM4 n=1 Tax=Vitrella brassicaformis (strain CCMP3155) TaxID=1169540 RepID=A0A0G4FTQ1_VITBC|nr:unnamed protein product [Vitrella brassicaformis CCMP3155]|eukprot:CEM17794.1 unnamed protein product [Vitrella brassicaformis CCMP3155]